MEIHQPCPACKSSDAATYFPEGNYNCFSCGGSGMLEGFTAPAPRVSSNPELLHDLDIKPISARGLSLATCKKFNYGCGRKHQVAPYYDGTGMLVGQKLRDKDKNMSFRGDNPGTLFGQQLWSPNPKLRIVITEGEVDALSVYEAQGDWPVVSVPSGSGGARKALAKQLDWLGQFKEVVLWFDNDTPGQEAVAECAPLFEPGKVKIAYATGDSKDANDMLLAGQVGDMNKLLMRAAPYRPPGIVAAADLREEVMAPKEAAFAAYPWKDVDENLCGIRRGEIVLWTAGSGTGKSTVTRQIAYDLLVNQGVRVGYLAFEESAVETIHYLMGMHLGTQYHMRMSEIDQAQKDLAFDAISTNLVTDRHDGSLSTEDLENKIKHLVLAEECDVIVIDHVSIVVSGLESANERKDLDVLMTKLRSMAQRLRCNFQVIAHIKRQQGTPANEGGRIHLTDLRGSAALEQLSNQVVALERNQQGNEKEQAVTTVRILKNRFAGWLMGARGWLQYDTVTGLMKGIDQPVEEDDDFDDDTGGHDDRL